MIEPKIVGNQFAEDLVCKLDTQGYSHQKIADALAEADGPKVSRMAIWKFLNNKTSQPIVQRCRQKFLTAPQTVDIYHKRVRLEDLNRERVRIIRTIDYICGKEEYVPDKKVNKYLGLSKRLIDIEIAGRDEIEKRPDMIALFQRIGPYSEVSDADLLRETRLIEQKLIAIRTGKGLDAEKSPIRPRAEVESQEKPA